MIFNFPFPFPLSLTNLDYDLQFSSSFEFYTTRRGVILHNICLIYDLRFPHFFFYIFNFIFYNNLRKKI